ncbi:phosphate/phosphite/phosphonate ABC transporter substrate-binding protein [Ferribacterium limneticum]|uniref:phosphate/phosphite/phosphonate ABC transporter substrate-binding protein n=1 Tax=Ferribacterium limneticum TaxID=76259 RepID=UPI001CF819C3|nr:PhnD/SsuA/transferrin family substrate-binding protein [Ferribacterium limneticum]UCV21372.1 PhnD/SsuA/transferrin family substrate-binding protein [Ferribacterium limneticum]
MIDITKDIVAAKKSDRLTRSGYAVGNPARRRVVLGLLATLGMTLAEQAIPAARAADAPLVMGIFPRRHATLTTELYAPLAAYLSRELGREVRLVTAKDFDAFWEGVEQRRFDIVHYNQFHYVRSADKYRVIAHNEEFGLGTVAGALYVRKDSGISAIEQLRGRKIVFGGGTDAMMSYILPSYLLLQAGLQPTDYETVFSKNPPNSLISLFHGKADASGAGDILIDLPVVRNAMDTSTVTHLGMTERLLHLPWAVRKDMPKALSARIQVLLVGLKASEEGRAILTRAEMTGFGAASDVDYDPHRRIIRKVMPAMVIPH